MNSYFRESNSNAVFMGPGFRRDDSFVVIIAAAVTNGA